MKKRKNKKKSNLPFIVLFIIGFCILMYPVVSRFYYKIGASKAVSSFESEKTKLEKKEIERRMRLAYAFNDSLVNGGINIEDPYDKKRAEEGRAEYARMLEVHEMIGHINIPKINIDIPMYAGSNETVLQKGAGHLEGTSLPVGGNNTHSVITAHRGLPEAKLFTDLDKLNEGDKFYITNINETLAYEVDQIKVIEPSNFNDLLIVKGYDYVTLLTCTPYMINSHRLLVRGHRIDYDATQQIEEIKTNSNERYIKAGMVIIGIIGVLGIVVLRKKKKKNEV